MARKKTKEVKNVSFPSIASQNLTDTGFLDQLQENLQHSLPSLFDKSIPYQKLGERVVSITTGSESGVTTLHYPGAVHDVGDFEGTQYLSANDGAEANKGFTPILGDCTVDEFGFNIPAGATITKLVIYGEWRAYATGTANFRARWTKDGGSNWTTILSSSSGTGETTALGDGALIVWGGTHDITPAQANDDDNFQVQFYGGTDGTNDIRIDYVGVIIHYTGTGETTSLSTNNVATMPVTATAGSVMFAETGSDPYLQEDNTNFFWDDTNNRLGIGTNTPSATLDVDGSAIFNDSGADVNFRIEGDTEANLFFVDAGNDRIGIGTNTPLRSFHMAGSGAIIENSVAVTTFPSGVGLVVGPSDAVNEGGDIMLQAPGGSYTTAFRMDNYQNTFRFLANSSNAGGGPTHLLYMTTSAITFNEEGSDIDIRMEGDTATNLLKLDAGLEAVQIGTTTAGVIADFRSTGIVFNENGADQDFRVEGDTDTNLLVIDAGQEKIGIGESPASAKLHIVDSVSIPPINITERSSAPSSPAVDDIYLDDGTNTNHALPGFRRYTGAAWEDLGGGGAPEAIKWAILL